MAWTRSKVVCYYESWQAHNYAPEDIDVSVCTHINFAFMGINEDGSLRLDAGDGILRRLSALKSRNPNLKLLFSVGGWNEGSSKFSRVASTSAKNTMARSVIHYMKTYGFDGVDIDWEYPGQRGGSSADKENFIDMLRIIKRALHSNGGGLLTVAASPVPEHNSYNVRAISEIVDFINLMTYDFHMANEGTTGHNSPLYPSSSDSPWKKANGNCNAAITNWLRAGASPQKLILGLAFYGHTFQLANSSQHGVGAPVVGKGLNDGDMTYFSICNLNGWTEVWDHEQEVPYRYSGNQWVSYENPRSIGLKVQYAKGKNLGGVMMWAVNQDNNGALLRAIKNNI